VRQPDWHTLETDAALQRLNTSENGLTTAEANQRLAEYGPNTIPEARHRTILAMLPSQFADAIGQGERRRRPIDPSRGCRLHIRSYE